jgi:predicted ester cyclase
MESPKVLVRRYYEEVLNQRRPEVLGELLAPSFQSRNGSFVADAARYTQAVHRTLATFGDLRVTIEAQVAEGDLVATRWSAQGTFLPTGQPFTQTGMHFHRVSDGHLAEHWEELDPSELKALLGN